MKVTLACLADYASVDQRGGKLSINGVFDRIHAPSFPARHAKMCLVFRLMFEWEDREKPHALTITLRDSDGKEYQRIEAKMQADPVAPGQFATLNQIIEVADAVFVKPGRYHFALRADSEDEMRVPFEVVQSS